MEAKFLDYYEVLGIWPTADVEAIKKAYFSLAKIHHPDVAKAAPDDGVDFKLINEAFSILSDAVRRREFDERLKQKKGGGAAAVEPEKRDADKRSGQLAFEQARAAMRHNRYDKAVVLLRSAIKYDDSNPAYHSWYGYSLGVLKTHLHEARDSCKRALEMEFYNADFHANLGYVYYQAGLTSTAKESFAEALKWDPEHPIAVKYSGGKPVDDAQGSGLSGIFSFLKRPAKKAGKKAGKGRARKARQSPVRSES